MQATKYVEPSCIILTIIHYRQAKNQMNIKRFNKPSVHITFLILVVLIFYAHTFDSGFMFDDYPRQEIRKLISNNEREDKWEGLGK